MADAILLHVPRQIQLVFGRDLPGEAQVVVTVRVVVDGGPGEIGHVRPRRRILVVVIARHERRVRPPTLRREEPQFVLLDRATQRSAVIVDIVHRTDRRKAAGLQPRWNAGAVQVVVGVARVKVPVRLVTARLRHQVHLDATELVLGRIPAQLNRDLRRPGRIVVEPGSGIGRLHRVPPHPVNQPARVASTPAVDRKSGSRVGAIAAADVGRPGGAGGQRREIGTAVGN